MDLAGIRASTEAVLKEVPELEGFVEALRMKLTESVEQVVTEAMRALADGIGQMVALGQSLDGATVSLVIDPIVIPPIPAIRAVLTVHMPLKPQQ